MPQNPCSLYLIYHQHVTIGLVSTREGDQCPTCQTHTLAGQGWFTRRIHSLPCLGQAVVLLIQARRFRCPNPACPRKTFREDLSALADRYQRRTQAATQLLCGVAAIAGRQAGARLAAQMQLPTSRSTLQRCLVRHAACPEGTPRVVGVDDFAWTKRRRYGTILVDLETHRLVALSAGCEEETVASWFRQHPGVQIVTRDRSPTKARGHSTWGPSSAAHCGSLPFRYERHDVSGNSPNQRAGDNPPSRGWSQRAIAQETGLHPQTVATYLHVGQLPERAPHPPRWRVIEPYLNYLQQRWEQGEHNGRLLFEEIRAQGYPAGLTEVYLALQRL